MIIKNIYYFWLNWKIGAKITSSLICVTSASILALLMVNYYTNVTQSTAQTGSQMMILGDQTVLRAAEVVEAGVKNLETLARTPSIITAVQTANLERIDWTADAINALDQSWKDNDPGIANTQREIAANEISIYLTEFIKNNPDEVEVFVTDVKGLNIAMTDTTSDFLQADEGWWKSAFANGTGESFIDSVEYDESAKTYAMNIGVPIRDPNTKKAIGVLRGTLDISVMINTLGNVKSGKTGSVTLIDSQGIVIYSQDATKLIKPAPDAILTLFKSGKSGWARGLDLDGHAAILAYSILGGELGKSLGWRMIVDMDQTEANQSVVNSLLISLLASLLVMASGIFITALVIKNSIIEPLGLVTKMAKSLSLGDTVRDMSDAEKDKVRLRKDEIGHIGKAFDRLIAYFQAGAEAYTRLAQNDLTVEAIANSEKDELGNAFIKMVAGLREIIGQMAESANAVSTAAAQLATTSEQSGEATSQIATTIQQVALGIAQQTAGVTKTTASVEQMGRVIDGVARGAQEQAKAISMASQITSRINSAIEQVTNNAQSVTRDSAQAASYSRAGAKTVKETIIGMEAIRSKVGLSATKVEAMGTRSEEIGTILETIEDIASQTNLLALNAAIEAARVGGSGKQVNEKLAQVHLVSVAKMLAELLCRTSVSLRSEDLAQMSQRLNVETLSISDADGVIVFSSQPEAIGFRFPDNGIGQAAAFRSLLGRDDGVVVQPTMARGDNGKPYLFVGVSRRDQIGIIQTGMPAQMLFESGDISRGFAVVADEVRKLAERSSIATKEIAALIKGIQKTVSEAVTAMKASAVEVEAGVTRANSAGEVLDNILEAAESVYKQAEDAGKAAAIVSGAASELVEAVDSVSAVIEENTAATEAMAANSSELTQTIENIASVSEENSASIEQVSAATEEVSAQVEEVSASATSLMEMAEKLKQVVSRFKLTTETGRS